MLAALLLLPFLVLPAQASERLALMIGNAAYAHAPRLANPFNDAGNIGSALERLGFAVTRLENAGRAQLWDGPQKFALAPSASETAVVFYAGRGIDVDNRTVPLLVDARLVSVGDVVFEAMSPALVVRVVDEVSNFRPIIFDACRANPFAVAMRGAAGCEKERSLWA